MRKILDFHEWIQISAVLRLVSAVLLFGNLEFFQEKKSDQAILPDDRGLRFDTNKFMQTYAICIVILTFI